MKERERERQREREKDRYRECERERERERKRGGESERERERERHTECNGAVGSQAVPSGSNLVLARPPPRPKKVSHTYIKEIVCVLCLVRART